MDMLSNFLTAVHINIYFKSMSENNDEHMSRDPVNSAEESIEGECDLFPAEVLDALKDTADKLETYNPQLSEQEALADRIIAMQLKKFLRDQEG
jgi:hypothetical protein